MHYYSERRVKGFISGGYSPARSEIILRLSRDCNTPGMIDGMTLSLSNDQNILIGLSDEGIRAILDMIAESSPEGGIEWGF